MGKSQKPLRIAVDPEIADWEEFKELHAQGHELSNHAMDEEDVILSPRAWLMDESHRKYLPLALAEARKRRYPTKEKE